MSDLLPSGGYEELLTDLRRIIVGGRGQAVAAVNAAMVNTYWKIGERIVRQEQAGHERAAYGEQVLALLGRTLSQEFGRAFGERNLYFMRQFYLAYPILNALRSELSWTHYRILMRLDPDRRSFYEQLCVTGRWSSRELERQIASMLFERAALSRRPEALAEGLPGAPAPATVDQVFHDPYLLDFLDLQDTFSERDLEAALIHNIERFLLELGAGFCFLARQKRITIGDEDYYIDLVFFHRYLRCLVLVDLKIGSFETADAAQMKLYLNWTRQHDQQEGEADPVGLILCGSRNEQVVELLLADPRSSMDQRIKVAQYLLLQSEAALKERLAHLNAVYEQARAEGREHAD